MSRHATNTLLQYQAALVEAIGQGVSLQPT
jgi:hypothetical protein